MTDAARMAGRRYLLSANGVISEGVASAGLSIMMENIDNRKVSYPVGVEVFKSQKYYLVAFDVIMH